MSGICGLLHPDGRAVDCTVLQTMTAAMCFRGPDAQDIWLGGQVGFGHTLLKTTFESEREQQPCSLDGHVWITADARIDGQDELKAKLLAAGRRNVSTARDEELILHAYHVWGRGCLQHLIGDFSFALWDSQTRLLFCARDHLGVKPFFYAYPRNCVVFSNTLECLRTHPAVSVKLDDHVIGDFLLFGQSFYPERTVFADIQRLQAGHTLTWSPAGGLHIRRYWSLPTTLVVDQSNAGDYDYVANFKALLDMSVSDRLRTNRVCVTMSGGLDSTSVAAVAQSLLERRGDTFALSAHAIVYDHLIPDKERCYSGLAAKHMGIPIHYCVADDYRPYERWREASRTPEPVHNPQGAMNADAVREIALLGRIALTGWDGDALLSEPLRPRLRSLAARREYRALTGALLGYLYVESLLAMSGLQHWKRRFLPRPPPARGVDAYPEWLNPEFEIAVGLRQRWRDVAARSTSAHPTRPYAYSSFEAIQSRSFFEGFDASWTRSSVEYRHPLMDLRLLRYCLALPHQPWVLKKHILREAMRGLLPEQVRRRPKAALAGDPISQATKCGPLLEMDAFCSSTVLREYVKDGKLDQLAAVNNAPGLLWYRMTPISLQCWLSANALN